MATERIIQSPLDTDLYKLTMGQAVFHNHSTVDAGYQFVNRGGTPFPVGFDQQLREQVDSMADLSLNHNQRRFLEEKTPLSSDYLDWFSNYRFDPREVSIRQNGGELSVNIDGPWERTIYWEVPLMATISELYFRNTGHQPDKSWESRCQSKAQTFREAGIRYTDFGTRRRFSFAVQDQVIDILKNNSGPEFLGTSNVELAMRHHLNPGGTYAHEWVMGQAGIYGVEQANSKAMDLWQKEFGGRLSTALTDTLTTEVFLRSFDSSRAKVFKTLRQDSGVPEKWTDQIINHLRTNLDLDPMDFTALYSDSLNPRRVLEIDNYAKGKMKTLFGIGTNLTNDVGAEALNMVIKMFYVVRAEFPQIRLPVLKISDTPGKITGSREQLNNYLQRLALYEY